MKKIVATAVAAMMLISSAYAAAPEVTFDYYTGLVHIQGTEAVPGETITVNIIDPDITPEQLYTETGESILYSNDTTADKDGNYNFLIPLTGEIEPAIYQGYIGAKSFSASERFSLAYMNFDDYTQAVARVNSAASGDSGTFKTVWDELGKSMGLYNSLTDSLDPVKTAALLQQNIKENPLSATDSVSNLKIYNTVSVMEAFNESKITSFDDYADMVIVRDAKTIEFYKTIVSKGNGKDTFNKLMSGKDLSSFQNWDEALEDAVMLTVTAYPDGIGNIETVLKQYSSRTGANTSNAQNKNYADISGRLFDNVSLLVTALNNSIKNNTTGGGSGGGGGGTGGSGGSSGGSSISGGASNIAVNGSSVSEVQEIPIKFEDLNTVPWAYEAISRLFTKGVITGRSETVFSPEDAVTREEFVKLVVLAFGFSQDAQGDTYTDVPSGAWYEPFVYAATQNGICQGIGNSEFGVGEKISRQDMSVMIYRAMKAKGMSLTSAELTFSDSDKIADYAREAVAALANAGVVNGVGDNLFDAEATATRAQAAVIINNALN